ncbi:STAS domain-containing protein [Cerasicoccus frondis]|uniref:STAS domain-containing protein n=1 Tax=Cerasicoccus frondis TaxID=490090 RepID=UPI0028529576|nr:STAS domain-containing protein [Cerasicoccus frondis]
MSTEHFSVEPTADACIFAFTGQLHAAACGAMNDDLMVAVEESEGPVVFDLGGVTFVASSFLRTVLTINRSKSREGFSIVNVQPDVKKVFKMAGLWDALGMAKTN